MGSNPPVVRPLRADQVQAYRRDGYVVVPEVFPPDELAAIDAEIDRLIALPGVAAGPTRQAVAVPVRAGSVVLFSAWTWHHSKNNHTGDIRRAVIVSYQEAILPGGKGEQWKILRPA